MGDLLEWKHPRYKITRILGEGGMGIVYEAIDLERDTKVALKTLRNVNPSSLYGLKNEFRSLADVAHHNLISLYELVVEDKRCFFTMELLEGIDFLSWVRRFDPSHSNITLTSTGEDSHHTEPTLGTPQQKHHLDVHRLRDGLYQLAAGIVALHKSGHLHRDIKPSNVMVTRSGRLVILDFGLITQVGPAIKEQQVCGTPAYVAPEIIINKSAPNESSDWYAVGVMLFEALTGSKPFRGTIPQIIKQKQEIDAPLPEKMHERLPEDLCQLCTTLLSRTPDVRPKGSATLAKLSIGQRPVQNTRTHHSKMPFVGRDPELDFLRLAFDDAQQGRAVTVGVIGASGLGKTELVNHFTRSLHETRSDVVVLTGRCYEREAVPYKAFDDIADSLSRYLMEIPPLEAAALLPFRAGLLPQLFPVLNRVAAIADAPQEKTEGLDPHDLRHRMFDSLRELFGRLCKRRPVVLVVDDFQWADVDSFSLFTELLHPPDEPPMMVIATIRSDLTNNETGARFGEGVADLRHLEVLPLSKKQSIKLIKAIAPETDDATCRKLSVEAGGHPFFIHELLRYVGENALSDSITLNNALSHRILNLNDNERNLIEALCVSGVPITQEAARMATELKYQEFEQCASMLRVENLIRRNGARKEDTIEVYHGRIRESVIQVMPPEKKQKVHGRIAYALERSGTAEESPHELVRHFLAAGATDRAAAYAEKSAERATKALAFDQAAEYWKQSLDLTEHDPLKKNFLELRLAQAYVKAGRSNQGAEIYMQLSEHGSPEESLRYRRIAAEQWLISGHLEKGLEATSSVLTSIGVTMPATQKKALFSVLIHRIKIKLRRLKWTPTKVSEIDISELTKVDIFQSVCHGLALVDNIRAADFQSQAYLLSLKLGEPSRVGMSFSMETIFMASQGKDAVAADLIERARVINEEIDNPYLSAMVDSGKAALKYFSGHFLESNDLFTSAEKKFIEQPDATWERISTRMFRIYSMMRLGRFKDLAPFLKQSIRDANNRGDRYMETTLRRAVSLVNLVQETPEVAEENLKAAKWPAPEGAFHLQHWYELESNVELAIYKGDAQPSLDEYLSGFDKLARSMLLRVKLVRCLAYSLKARLLLATDGNLKEVASLGKKIAEEKPHYAQIFSALIRSAVAMKNGKRAQTIDALNEAISVCETSSMTLHGNVAKWRLASLLGEAEGTVFLAEAESWARGEKVHNFTALAQVIAPGFPSK